MTVLTMMLAGALGAVARFVVDGAVKSRWSTTFPWATFVINVTGSFLLGVLTGAVLFHTSPSALTTIAGTGFCGGYTTFSTASFETVRLAEGRQTVVALTYAVASVLCGVAGAAAGLVVAWAA
ncbi:fluoride efflux transporter FluC [Gordonia rhizosphera]|uniref:Fluoride-specific ion channel FluC n=1 Tax=Gordonia rhizosphera NBRC 16068 TaxID=1108045 RepID=K6WBZ5_9ACTN|nr:CrcB family protein [Gordonia rhizosphera]GAB91266.1 protein CrcB homolog [Gordonia rhizosphera NBRC 16068]